MSTRVRITLSNNDNVEMTVDDVNVMLAELVQAMQQGVLYRPTPDQVTYLNPAHVVLIKEADR